MPLSRVLCTTQKHLHVLREMGLETVEDLLLYFPRAHEDLSTMQRLREAPLNEKVTVRGRMEKLKQIFTRSRKQIITGTFIDEAEMMADVIWFNQMYIMRTFKNGDEVVLTGKISEKNETLQMVSPQIERAGERELVHSGRLVPIYPQHESINTKWIREKMILLRSAIDDIDETLPAALVEEEHLLSRKDAIRALHFPENEEEVKRACDRIGFEAMYRMQESALCKKREWQRSIQDRLKIPMDTDLIKKFFASLKFLPTDSQKIAIYEILKDLESGRPMSRLLEGDTGSGKTLVATVVMANVIKNGGQCALMVPTEVLARQHFESVIKQLSVVGCLLTGSTLKSESERIKLGMANGTIDLVIGTHALIEESVQFKNLCLVVIDEQHRFGVVQRECLAKKGTPHVLHMTATPIPRTLALTAYGHHDLSVLTEKPLNRPPIHTKLVLPRDRRTVESFIDGEIGEGRQAFVICPLIEQQDDRKSVEEEFERLRQVFPHRRVAMLHGRMPSQEKESTMRGFKAHRYDILVSTSVVEVGIDIPNASIMLIEGAERFGLSQLHQFRGRVGRGEYKSYCFLCSSDSARPTSVRLKALEECNDGFKLAEIDLKLRGPGSLFGTRQSGIPENTLIHLLNPKLVVRARRAVEKYIQSTPSPWAPIPSRGRGE